METPSTSIPISELLAHETWLRRVVVDLVTESEADDILQETWIAALGARDIANPRAWLRRVAQNLARVRRRGEARRHARESSVARDEAVASTDSIVERLHVHRDLAEAVGALDEPYRTAVLLRYFEDLSPSEIARRLGVPASTVRTQIDRGLRMVRGRFEGRDVRALATLVLLPRLGETAPPVTLAGTLLNWGVGVLAMSLRHKILIATTLIASLSSLSFWLRTDAAKPDADPVQASKVSVPDGPLVKHSPVTRSAVDPQAGGSSVPVVALPEGPPVAPLRGLVLDARGAPVAGVPLTLFFSGPPIVTTVFQGVAPIRSGPKFDLGVTDHEGRFSAAVGKQSGQIQAGGDWVSVRFDVPDASDRAEKEALVVVARRTSIGGQVVDDAGLPLAGVSVVPLLNGLLEYEAPLDHTSQLGVASCLTDANGAFKLRDVPELPELELRFTMTGFDSESLHEVAGREDLMVRLHTAPEGAYRVRGTVVDHHGRLVRGAMVLLGRSTAVTGRFGEFSLKSRSLSPESSFGACVPGFQPAVRSDVVTELLEGLPIAPVTLHLGGPALAIHGHVVDMDGDPLPDMTLTLLDATRVDTWQTVEDFVANRETKPTNVRGLVMRVDASTDEDGKFEIVGLMDRSYRVRVFDHKTLASRTVELVAGARDVVLKVDLETLRTVSGIVKSRAGQALSNVSVRWGLMTLEGPGLSLFAPGTVTETNTRGEFTLTDVPMGGCVLNLSGGAIVDHTEPLAGILDGASITITPRARCRVRVWLDDSSATRVQFLDAVGSAIDVKRTMGQMSIGGDGWDLKNGRTPVLEVSDAVTTLVVLRDGKEVARYPVTLGVADLTTLEF